MNRRKNNRLQDFDYSQNGAYFVTICTKDRGRILSDIRRGDPCGRPNIELSEIGKIAEKTISVIENMYDISVDKYVIMPNHIHMIILICHDDKRATARVAPTVGDIVGGYKSLISNQWLKICKQRNSHMGQIWQRSYYDHVIRNKSDYQRIWQYIDNNQIKWELDCYYTE